MAYHLVPMDQVPTPTLTTPRWELVAYFQRTANLKKYIRKKTQFHKISTINIFETEKLFAPTGVGFKFKRSL